LGSFPWVGVGGKQADNLCVFFSLETMNTEHKKKAQDEKKLLLTPEWFRTHDRFEKKAQDEKKLLLTPEWFRTHDRFGRRCKCIHFEKQFEYNVFNVFDAMIVEDDMDAPDGVVFLKE
jgi:hypothetical protein